MAYQPLQLHPFIGSNISKQWIVFKVKMGDAKKRSKALKTAVGFPGVLAATLQGDDRIVVQGEGLDPVKLTKKLKKKLGSAELVSFTNGHDKHGKVHLSDGHVMNTSMTAASMGPYPYVPVHPQPSPYHGYSNPPQPQYYYQPYYEYDNGPNCAVM